VKLINTNNREHIVYKAGFEYNVPRGEIKEIPDRIALAMLRRFPCLEEWVDDAEQKRRIKKKATVAKLKKKKSMKENLPTIELVADK